MPNRHTDKPDVSHTQTERVFQSDHEWFFCTREGIGVGPYATRELAGARGQELSLRLSKLSGETQILAEIRHFVFETSGFSELHQSAGSNHTADSNPV